MRTGHTAPFFTSKQFISRVLHQQDAACPPLDRARQPGHPRLEPKHPWRCPCHSKSNLAMAAACPSTESQTPVCKKSPWEGLQVWTECAHVCTHVCTHRERKSPIEWQPPLADSNTEGNDRGTPEFHICLLSLADSLQNDLDSPDKSLGDSEHALTSLTLLGGARKMKREGETGGRALGPKGGRPGIRVRGRESSLEKKKKTCFEKGKHRVTARRYRKHEE